MPRGSRTSERDRRDRNRILALEAQQKERERTERAALRERIHSRLRQVPELWRAQYRNLLEQHNLSTSADLARITSLAHLKARADLLPPSTVYVHFQNAHHPSIPEPRAVNVEARGAFLRATNKRHCSNTHALSSSLFTFPESPNVAKVKPHNLLLLVLPSGHKECVNVNALRKLHRNGFVLSNSYQRDAHGDHWAEMLVDTHRHGTIRVPLWLLKRATNTEWKIPSPRRQPPHQTVYA